MKLPLPLLLPTGSLCALLLSTCLPAQSSKTPFTLVEYDRIQSSSSEVRAFSLGDIDSDGHVEFVVANSIGRGSGGRTGRVHMSSMRDFRMRWEAFGESDLAYFGRSIVRVDDLDQDGVDDLVVGAPNQRSASNAKGAIYVLSGRTGIELHRSSGSSLGEQVVSIGDADNDGAGDFLVATDQDLRAISGKSFQPLYSVTPGSSEQEPGKGLYPAPDVDKDGVPDFLALWGRMVAQGQTVAREGLRLHSGKDGSVLYELADVFPAASLEGPSCVVVDDADGDGVPDVGVCRQIRQSSNDYLGTLEVYSLRTGNFLWRIPGTAQVNPLTPESAHLVADLDQDGVREIAVHYPSTPDGFRGGHYVVSGKTGAHVRTLHHYENGAWLGAKLASIGDIDGDQIPELLVSTISASSGAEGLVVLSLSPRSLRADRLSLSIWKREGQVLSIDAGASYASHLAFLVGSASGTSPGFGLGSLHIALNFDPYMALTASAPFALVYKNLQQLDVNGRAMMGWQLPAGAGPNLSGLRFDHAALIFGPSGFVKVTESVGVSLRAF